MTQQYRKGAIKMSSFFTKNIQESVEDVKENF